MLWTELCLKIGRDERSVKQDSVEEGVQYCVEVTWI